MESRAFSPLRLRAPASPHYPKISTPEYIYIVHINMSMSMRNKPGRNLLKPWVEHARLRINPRFSRVVHKRFN